MVCCLLTCTVCDRKYKVVSFFVCFSVSVPWTSPTWQFWKLFLSVFFGNILQIYFDMIIFMFICLTMVEIIRSVHLYYSLNLMHFKYYLFNLKNLSPWSLSILSFTLITYMIKFISQGHLGHFHWFHSLLFLYFLVYYFSCLVIFFSFPASTQL